MRVRACLAPGPACVCVCVWVCGDGGERRGRARGEKGRREGRKGVRSSQAFLLQVCVCGCTFEPAGQ